MKNFFDNSVVQNVVNVRFAKFEVLNFLALSDLQKISTDLLEQNETFISMFYLLVEIFKANHINYVGAEFFPFKKAVLVHINLLEK